MPDAEMPNAEPAPRGPKRFWNGALWVLVAVVAWLALQPLVMDRIAPADCPTPVAGAKVEMWRTSWCPYCKKANDFFRACGLDFVEYDVETSAAAHAEFKALGGRGVPLIRVHGKLMSGFDARRFTALYQSGG
jgi:glutaredoxin